MSEYTLEVCELVKDYGDNRALDHVSFTLTHGIYALLGPNGAGKSTLINILCMLLDANEGCVKFNGTDIKKCKKEYLSKVGYMPQQHCLYEDFTLQDYLYYIGNLKGMKKEAIRQQSEDLVRKVKLEDVFHKKLKGFSGGMKQRAMLCVALLNDPSILILDEPSAGLDPLKRMEMQKLIAELSKDKIIIFATHVVSDVESIADEYLILKKGKLLRKETRKQLVSLLEHKVMEQEVDPLEYQKLKTNNKISNVRYDGDKMMIRIIEPKDEGKGIYVSPNINDVYLYIFDEEHFVL